MTHAITKEAESRMQKAVESARNEFTKIRTGKASPALLDSVRVNYHGASMNIKQVASVNTPEARLITVQPFDKSMIAEIEKAILKADLGLNPQNDGSLIRIPIPPLNEERRKDLVRACHKLAEDGRIAIRNIRRDAMEHLKKEKKDGKLSEDEEKKLEKEVQKSTDAQIGQVDDLLKRKEAEIMEV
jgi:ribosome recycling factor